jgi:thiol-disulfide isomerase/thioredoxin
MHLIESFRSERVALAILLASLALFGFGCSKQQAQPPKASAAPPPRAPMPTLAPIAFSGPGAPLVDLRNPDEPPPGASEADKAWFAVLKASRPPTPPAEWQTKPPTAEEAKKWDQTNSLRAGEAADLARDFYTRYPDHAAVAEAKERELDLLRVAVQLGSTNKLARLDELETAKLQDPSLDEDERFEVRAQQVQRAVTQKEDEGQAAVLAAFEKGARQLQKEFPKRPEPYAILLEIAQNTEGDKARTLAQEISTNDLPAELREAAQGLLKRLDALGKPLAIKFTAVDGREVDLANLKGKVVLVDFWATWCGPCVAELPNVKAAYDKLHAKGFEIVGISFDDDKEKLTSFTKKQNLPWPQYFEAGGDNKFGTEYNVASIPTMWLVDRKGLLRDTNARADLAAKVEKLLAEAP